MSVPREALPEGVLRYLRKTYRPRALIVYGSYARGDQDEYSDFDCMLLVDGKDKDHDDAVIDGVPLDCFIFTLEEARSGDIDPLLPAFDGRVILDDGSGEALVERTRRYVAGHTETDPGEKEFIASWIRKTMRRMEKGDDEGHMRGILFLAEGLMDYCLLRDIYYAGSKQAAALLRKEDPAGHALFHAAVTQKTPQAIQAWADHVVAPLERQAR